MAINPQHGKKETTISCSIACAIDLQLFRSRGAVSGGGGGGDCVDIVGIYYIVTTTHRLIKFLLLACTAFMLNMFGCTAAIPSSD